MLIKNLSVAAIQEGTVIDRITVGHGLKIIHLLKLAKHQKKVSVGLNLPSKLLGFKDLIKVEGRELTPDEANRVAILAPEATINIIRNYDVSEKYKVSLPRLLEGVLDCPNAQCISNHEDIRSFFFVDRKQNQINLTCKYCRSSFQDERFPGTASGG